VGVGVEMQSGIKFGVAGSNIEMWKTGCNSLETVWKLESDGMGARKWQGFHMVQGIYQIVSWKVVWYGRIEP